MKKYWILFLSVCSVSIFYFNNVDAYMKEYKLTSHPILNFEDPLSTYQITLKGTTYTHYTLLDIKSVNVSYIIKINNPIPKSAVYLSLQDKLGFEIVRNITNLVVQGYIGTLKGNLSLTVSQYQRIAGAELYFSVY